jgi:hypothetical protein
MTVFMLLLLLLLQLSAQVSNEVEVLTCAGSHPNLVPFWGWFVDSAGVLCLLLGHCEGGTLAALLKVRQLASCQFACKALHKSTCLAVNPCAV